MRKILSISIIILSLQANAQTPEDAVKFSWNPQTGNARTTAIGGAMGSLGGDISATFVNPAGIAFYKTHEFSFSPAFSLNNLKTNFRGNSNGANSNRFMMGTSGMAYALPSNSQGKKGRAFSLAFTQTANFNQVLNYKGLNNFSSFSEQFAEEFVRSGLSINEALNTKSLVPFTVAPALFTYLIDTVNVGGTLKVLAAPETILDAGQALQQEFNKTTKGGLYELAGSYAGEVSDKLLVGVTIGIPFTNLQSNTTVTERDTSNNKNNDFQDFTFTDNYTTKGIGVNAKIGIIYRPKDYIRLGLAIHTPSFMSQTDRRETTLTTNLENPVSTFNVSSNTFTDGIKGQSEYYQNTPWKFLLSGAYVFREVLDVTKQKGFISADVEYIKHSGSRFNSNAEEPSPEDKAYYKQLNAVVKDIYKGALNVRVGGEVKFNTLMGRLGFAYYGNPYKDAPVKANRTILSGGLGYRNKGYFIDLTYAHNMSKDFDVPYRLQNSETVFSSVKQTRGNIMATVGFKF
jgi:hypothetical protein